MAGWCIGRHGPRWWCPHQSGLAEASDVCLLIDVRCQWPDGRDHDASAGVPALDEQGLAVMFAGRRAGSSARLAEQAWSLLGIAPAFRAKQTGWPGGELHFHQSVTEAAWTGLAELGCCA